jgi:hypothetical protein
MEELEMCLCVERVTVAAEAGAPTERKEVTFVIQLPKPGSQQTDCSSTFPAHEGRDIHA